MSSRPDLSGIGGCMSFTAVFCKRIEVSVLKYLHFSYFFLSVSSAFIFAGFSILVEGRSFWLPELHHCVLHQKRGDSSRGGAAQDLPAGGASERKQTNQQQQQQSDTKQPCRTEKERAG